MEEGPEADLPYTYLRKDYAFMLQKALVQSPYNHCETGVIGRFTVGSMPPCLGHSPYLLLFSRLVS